MKMLKCAVRAIRWLLHEIGEGIHGTFGIRPIYRLPV
jgi:hypothetical protein